MFIRGLEGLRLGESFVVGLELSEHMQQAPIQSPTDCPKVRFGSIFS